MDENRVTDLMVPLGSYGTVNQHRTILEAIEALEAASQRLQSRGQPARAVLVVDDRGEVVGQLGHLDFLKALEPKYSLLGDLETIARAGVSEAFVDSMMESMSLWQDALDTVCRRAAQVEVQRVMRPIKESIDENATLTEAVHKMIMWQTMRVLVTRRGAAVGVLRLADVFDEIARRMRAAERVER
jgi:hypothetical protein